jgi:hypothetical protein
MVNLTRVSQRRHGGQVVPDDGLAMEIQAFLLAPENMALWKAVVDASEALDRSRTGQAHFDNADRVDALLRNSDDRRNFNRILAEFMPQSEKLLKGYPGYAMPERLDDILALRVVWNIVHAHGDDAAKAAYRKFIEDLRQHFAKRADKVTVKWLDQVMKEPGMPPEKYVVRLQLGAPEKPEAKEAKDSKKGQK